MTTSPPPSPPTTLSADFPYTCGSRDQSGSKREGKLIGNSTNPTPMSVIPTGRWKGRKILGLCGLCGVNLQRQHSDVQLEGKAFWGEMRGQTDLYCIYAMKNTFVGIRVNQRADPGENDPRFGCGRFSSTTIRVPSLCR